DGQAITLGQYSNDRNVPVVLQALGQNGQVLNSTPATAQFMGNLAPDLSTDNSGAPPGGSDYQPLGFDIHGALNNPPDVNVYSFNAAPGTEVWFQVGNSSPALSSVLELVDATGKVLASSDPSGGVNNNVLTGLALNVINDASPPGPSWGAFYSANTRDAMMRVILPGSGTSQTYFIRIRSHNALTEGSYELQVRLRQNWETPGSVIQYS